MDHSHFNHYTGEQAFGHSCATLRQQMKLTQGELARLLAVSEQDVERWEQGVHFPTPEQLKRFTGFALQRHAFPLDHEREAAEQLWLSAGQLANFEVFWRLAQQTAAFVPPALLVLKQEAVQSRAWEVPPSTPSCLIGGRPSMCTLGTGASRRWRSCPPGSCRSAVRWLQCWAWEAWANPPWPSPSCVRSPPLFRRWSFVPYVMPLSARTCSPIACRCFLLSLS